VAASLNRIPQLRYFFRPPSGTVSGTAFAVFSGRDLVGNRGTEIDAGATIEVDARGPSAQLSLDRT